MLATVARSEDQMPSPERPPSPSHHLGVRTGEILQGPFPSEQFVDILCTDLIAPFNPGIVVVIQLL